ncbi:MAG: SDR family NAD(P)-dependent oxidoreductase [Solirubrobacterales bacterium]
MELRGRNALLTGAAGGLGHYNARSLAAEGVNLALCDLPAASVDDLIAELRPRGVTVESVPAELTDTAGLEALVRHAADAIGPLDILVNNAGLEFGGGFGHQTRTELEAIVSVNLLAVMELTRVVLPGMLERRRGHVVNVASMAGKGAFPYLASYSATKHGVVGFTHSMRGECADEPVGFSAICPIFISRVGMYARLEDATPDPPALLSPKPPERVGDAVVKAIRDDCAEVLVSGAGSRAMIAIHALAPKLAQWLNNRGGFREFAEGYSRARDRL